MLDASPPVMVSERVRKALQELGLTEYEIRTYLALVERGPLTASELSEGKLVPYSKVYEVVGSLSEKGFVETLLGRPARYAAKSPAYAIERLVSELERGLKMKAEAVVKELMPIYERRGGRERPDIWILRGETAVWDKIRDAAARCEEELLVAAPTLPNPLDEILYSFSLAAKARGCTVRIMVSSGTPKQVLNRLSDVADVRVRSQMFAGGVICDNREVVIVFTGEDGGGPVLAIWSDHAGLARFAKNYFEYLWNDAAKR
ncbi:hypothetical protein HRbin01_00249 [archaeon HR01]|nr:hypothetical protein HRbin01_00249 [archaeon HR01]